MTDIKTLNDNFRKTFSGGRVMLTCGINAKSQSEQAEILNQVRCFNNFTTTNDPIKLDVLIISPKQTIHITNTILAVFLIKENKFIGKLIIMIKIISFVQKIQVIQI